MRPFGIAGYRNIKLVEAVAVLIEALARDDCEVDSIVRKSLIVDVEYLAKPTALLALLVPVLIAAISS